jgi:hypothetical protein
LLAQVGGSSVSLNCPCADQEAAMSTWLWVLIIVVVLVLKKRFASSGDMIGVVLAGWRDETNCLPPKRSRSA